MRIWRKTKEAPEGKFLVVRRDGTIPTWPNFVLGARDPAVPAALKAYANRARELGMEEEYCDSVEELADEFFEYANEHGLGDPESGPHREDMPDVIEFMRNGGKIRVISR